MRFDANFSIDNLGEITFTNFKFRLPSTISLAMSMKPERCPVVLRDSMSGLFPASKARFGDRV